ncbi:hypothetical protein Z517_08205 [Fonsecaea pedrosoi CBS 271.37]|uniref:Unplaced genomic scaffold supercont1.5, whole genome shotgun sequence n=1 Tax=Fonsecaea pedrosoi CBS 271.37 TaxID=1442368 RepID=A0A0D2GIG9_9EURO|nr:uncharacterized protein Z517_08205 [Fonsecaea pedrosoi CBS 271.37]KIW78370.1 hypothetical protein Z517_08205 [Fonsecaea pedrosoi CBS 271.37]
MAESLFSQTRKQGNAERVKSVGAEQDIELNGLASLEYHERLTRFARGAVRHWVKNTTVIDFRPLYAVSIHHQQRQLLQEISTFFRSNMTDEQLDRIGILLGQYTNTLRNFEFIHSNRWNTYFVKNIAASRVDNGPGSRMQAALISEFGLALPAPQHTLYSDDDLLGSFDHSLMEHGTARGKTRGTERQQSELARQRREGIKRAQRRFIFAIIGGLVIVTPVLIIVVGTVSAKALAVVSISIFAFSVVVALFSAAEPESLLAATAAYAAVLVVFISNAKPIPA